MEVWLTEARFGFIGTDRGWTHSMTLRSHTPIINNNSVILHINTLDLSQHNANMSILNLFSQLCRIYFDYLSVEFYYKKRQVKCIFSSDSKDPWNIRELLEYIDEEVHYGYNENQDNHFYIMIKAVL